MSIIGIVAVDRNNAIGKDGRLPWHYSADLKFFKEQTIGNACVMGYRTWLSLKNPLPNRLNIVLSRRAQIETNDSLLVMRDVDSVLSYARDLKCDLFVMGGSQVYQSVLPYIDKWVVTEVPLTIKDADTFVPTNFLDGFIRTESRKISDELNVSFYERE